MSRKSFPLSKVYGLLEPGPVVLVTTARKTKANIMTMSWYTMMEFEPPIVGCVISNRNYTFNILKATKECDLAAMGPAYARDFEFCAGLDTIEHAFELDARA